MCRYHRNYTSKVTLVAATADSNCVAGVKERASNRTKPVLLPCATLNAANTQTAVSADSYKCYTPLTSLVAKGSVSHKEGKFLQFRLFESVLNVIQVEIPGLVGYHTHTHARTHTHTHFLLVIGLKFLRLIYEAIHPSNSAAM
jgi:hypothetical protein